MPQFFNLLQGGPKRNESPRSQLKNHSQGNYRDYLINKIAEEYLKEILSKLMKQMKNHQSGEIICAVNAVKLVIQYIDVGLEEMGEEM